MGMKTYLGNPVVRVRETATFVDLDGRPRFLLLLGELPAGHGYLYAMQLPWGGPETERVYDSVDDARTDAWQGLPLMGRRWDLAGSMRQPCSGQR